MARGGREEELREDPSFAGAGAGALALKLLAWVVSVALLCAAELAFLAFGAAAKLECTLRRPAATAVRARPRFH